MVHQSLSVVTSDSKVHRDCLSILFCQNIFFLSPDSVLRTSETELEASKYYGGSRVEISS